MQSTRGLLLCVSMAAACATTGPEPQWRSVEFRAGPQGLDESSWAPLDARVAAGLYFSGRKPEWPCGLEFGMQYARAESQDESIANGADFLDFRGGAAWQWQAAEWLELVAGGGPRLCLVEVDVPGTFMPSSEQGTSVGLYAHAGAFVRVAGGFSIGVEGQWADGTDYEVLGGSQDASETELLLALRWDI